MSEKIYQIHVKWVNKIGQSVYFTSDYMTFEDCLQVKIDNPFSVITITEHNKTEVVQDVG